MRNNAHNAATKNIKKKKIFVLCAGEVSEVSIDKHGNHPINNRRTGNCPEWACLKKNEAMMDQKGVRENNLMKRL